MKNTAGKNEERRENLNKMEVFPKHSWEIIVIMFNSKREKDTEGVLEEKVYNYIVRTVMTDTLRF
jgi:hypothetical protein